jgi:hypothetical protein
LATTVVVGGKPRAQARKGIIMKSTSTMPMPFEDGLIEASFAERTDGTHLPEVSIVLPLSEANVVQDLSETKHAGERYPLCPDRL